nr:hypothetical protein [Tanacetum cinerariifolium]
MGGLSSQPRTDPTRSPISTFSIEELYTLEFSESLQENTAYWQEPNTGERVVTSPTKKKKATRNRQKRVIQNDDAPRQTTTEKEIMLAKDWRAISKNSQHDNARKKDRFLCEVLAYIESITKQEGSEGSSKRHKLSGASSFKAESGDASINLNTTVADEDEVQEIRRPQGRDKARVAVKNKGSKASGSSTMNDDALARLMVNEMTSAQVQQRESFM